MQNKFVFDAIGMSVGGVTVFASGVPALLIVGGLCLATVCLVNASKN
ncbi:hypothetical protein [Phascolarctobacterium sp.]